MDPTSSVQGDGPQERQSHADEVVGDTANVFHRLCPSRLIGGLVYEKTIRPYGYFFPGKKWPCDTNSNLECLRRILEDIKARKGKLPKKLYIQMDNTSKDNKNWIMFTYLGYLILSG